MNEGSAKAKIKRILEREDCNALVLTFAGSAFQSHGIPDWFVAHRIWSGWIEWKYDKGVLTPAQKVMLQKLEMFLGGDLNIHLNIL
jgi:hypothetical protein